MGHLNLNTLTFLVYNIVTDELQLIERLPSGDYITTWDGATWRIVAPAYLRHLECIDVLSDFESINEQA